MKLWIGECLLETFLESRFGGGESSFWDSHFGDNFRACIYSEKTFKFSEVLGWKLMNFKYRGQVNFKFFKRQDSESYATNVNPILYLQMYVFITEEGQ